MEDIQENLLPSSSHNQQPLSIDEELWLMAEERAQEILFIIQPNVVSEVNRKEIINYVQRLIGGYYGAEVFPFGSVPLKTYLPDGDIDLTALSQKNVEEDLAQAVCSILASGGDDAEYHVKDIQYIRAQVQVVKCTVKNIAVDISFNQVAGLYALSFLEQVDQLLGKNHLFKRSIILIKAWCYYESRILGAHHGLLSTYAVETLVLYIINVFHSSVRGPLEVLYRFLDYYSTFDWNSYCVSINGPVTLSSLPEIVETPECDRSKLLLSKEFLTNCRNMCSVPARASETMANEFPTKPLNILDPLRSDNNLGRSVSRGNFHRIRFALCFGARKLRQILTLPGESMGAALEKFFKNTLDRNGKGQRPDVEVPVPAFGTGRSEEPVLCGDYDSYYVGLQYGQLYHNYTMPLTANPSSPSSPSQADVHALSTQPNWSMFYQRGTDVYIPQPILYCPNALQQSDATHSLEEKGKSRGTGTFIPDVTHNSYWDIHTRVTRPRRCASVNHNVLPKSPRRKQLVEVHSETDMTGNSKSFEFSNDEFPILPTIRKASLSEAQESVHSETDMNDNSRSFEISNEEFPFFSSIRKTSPSEGRESVNSETDMNDNSRLFELSNEEFPLLPSICKTSPSEVQESVHSETDMNENSSLFEISNEEFPLPSVCKTSPSEAQESFHSETVTNGTSRSFEISNEDFPLLTSICKTSPSDAQESVHLIYKSEQARNSSSSRMNIKFGTYRNSQSLTELSLPTKDEDADFCVSSTRSTMLVVPRIAMERKKEFPESDEQMN